MGESMCYQFAGWQLLTSEWLTTIGTWVIGIAAVLYARAAHSLNVRNQARDEARARSRASNAAFSVATKLIRPQIYAFTAEKQLRGWVEKGDIDREVMRSRLNNLQIDLSEFQVSESEMELLSDDVAKEVRKLVEIRGKIVTVIRRYQGAFDSSAPDELSSATLSGLAELLANQLREFIDGSLAVGKRLGPSDLIIGRPG